MARKTPQAIKTQPLSTPKNPNKSKRKSQTQPLDSLAQPLFGKTVKMSEKLTQSRKAPSNNLLKERQPKLS
jgi:hypothetical protein